MSEQKEKDCYIKLLNDEVPPIKIGNKNKSGRCGMCGISVPRLYPQKVGQVNFMICENCKSVMDM